MAVYAYLRVSTDRQDVANQRYGLFEYANRCGLGPLQFVEDTTSGRLAWRERAVGPLLTETTQAGDVVLFAEISRMARSTLQVLEMLEQCMARQVTVCIAIGLHRKRIGERACRVLTRGSHASVVHGRDLHSDRRVVGHDASPALFPLMLLFFRRI